MKPCLITIINRSPLSSKYYQYLFELGHFYYLVGSLEDLDFAIEQELRYGGPPSILVIYKMSKEQVLGFLEQYPKTFKFKIIS